MAELPAKHSALLEETTATVVASLLGTSVPPTRAGLQALIAENAGLLARGDGASIAAALARQATALEIGCLGLLAVMAEEGSGEHRLALAKGAASLHGAWLKSLSALHQIHREEVHGAAV